MSGMAFKSEIQSWREKHSMTQKAAAEFLGVGMRTYQGWEQSESEPAGKPCLKCVRARMAELDRMGVPPTPAEPARAG